MTKSRLLTIVLSSALTLTSQTTRAQKSPMAEAAYARAQDHLVASRFADAATEMDTAVRYQPRFALGWYVLASARRRSGDCDRAVAAYRRYMELRPAEPDPYFGAGLCLQVVGDRQAAIAAFQHYLDNDHRADSASFVEIARKRVAELKRVPATAPAAPSPSLIEARQLRDHRRTEDAIARYRIAVAADPKSADAHAELGTLLVSVRRAKDAVDELRSAVRLDPAAAPAWYRLGFALRETGQPDEAVAAYRRYITFHPTDPDPHYGLGRSLAALGRNDEAAAAFRIYTTLETRPTERRWLKKARAEVARIESARPTTPTSAGQPSITPPALTATTPPSAPGPMPPVPPTTPTAKAKSAPPTEPTPTGHP